jgi:hypothetical protein
MGDSAPMGVDAGDASPVSSVSRLRSAAGQPAVRKHCFIGGVVVRWGRVTVRSCNQTVEVGTFDVGVHHRIGVPHPSMVCSTLGTLVPLLPQLGLALSTRAGLAQIIRSLLAVCSGQPWPEVFVIPHGRSADNDQAG